MSDAARYRRMLEITQGQPFFAGNRLDVYRNGDAIFPAMLDAISQATESIEFLTFVFWEGEISRRFVDAFCERAKAGVQVRVLIDAFGGFDSPQSYFDEMRDCGVDVRIFRPLPRWRLWRNNLRTHRKVLVCDAKVAFTGGVGIGDDWLGDADQPGRVRETQIRVRGPAVDGMRSGFLSNWLEAAGEVLDAERPPPVPAEHGEAAVQVIQANGGAGWNRIALMFRTMIDLAEHSLRISTAYFVPDPSGARALVAAAQRGVRVELLVPGKHADKYIPQLAGQSHYTTLLAAGVHILEYDRCMLHAKVMLVDDTLAMVGSPNFNHRSVRRDDEAAVIFIDQPTIRQLAADFQTDTRDATAVTADNWARRAWWRRLAEWFAYRLRHEL